METVHYLLMKAHTMVNQQILLRAAELGLTPGQPKVLECLMEHEGSDQKTISEFCEIKPSTTGDILAGMERKGLIARRQADGNRRSWYVYLTDKGRAAAAELANVFACAEENALRDLPEQDVAQLKRLLETMIGTLEAQRHEGKRFGNEQE